METSKVMCDDEPDKKYIPKVYTYISGEARRFCPPITSAIQGGMSIAKSLWEASPTPNENRNNALSSFDGVTR